MKLEGIHHVTAITGDAPGNVDFYTRVLGLRLVKKSVNQDDPTVYHLFYADEAGSAGSDITFFEYPGARRGRAGRGMVHTVVWRVGSADAVAFWEERLKREGVEVTRDGDRLTFADPEGLGLEIRLVETADEPLVAVHPEIAAELAIQGFDGVRAYTGDADASRAFLADTLGFAADGETGVRGARRAARLVLRLRRDRGDGLAGRRHRPPRRMVVAARGARGVAHSASRRAAGGRPASSTATTSSRSTSASRAACSSRSPRSARASRPTRTSSTSASGWRCLPPTSTCASRSRRS